MPKTFKKFILLFLDLIFISSSSRIQSIEQICSYFPNSFITEPHKTKYKWDVKKEFKNSNTKLGKGNFGLVKSVKSPFQSKSICEYISSYFCQNYVAVKQVFLTSHVLLELEILRDISRLKISPFFYGCHFDTKTENVYIVQEELGYSLDNPKIQTILISKSVNEKIALYNKFIKSIYLIWESGYVHNDIKPANLMLSRNLKKSLIIDFGVSSYRNWDLAQLGSSFYFSPNKWNLVKSYSDLDDLYSFAISIAEIENKGNLKFFFEIKDLNGKISICKINLPEEHENCRSKVAENVGKFLEKKGFGNFQNNLKDIFLNDVSFSSLIAGIIQFHEYPFTLKRTWQIIHRILNPYLII